MEIQGTFRFSGCILCGSFFIVSDWIWAFQPIVDVLRSQSHGVSRTFLGMSQRTLREVLLRSSKILFSTSAVRIIPEQPKSDTKNLKQLPTRKQDEQLQIISRRSKHREQKLEVRFWRSGLLGWVALGEIELIPISVRLISSVYQKQTYMLTKKVKIEPNTF